MTFAIPKQLTPLNSLVTPTVIDVELNDTDVDRMITRILEMAVEARKSRLLTNRHQGLPDLSGRAAGIPPPQSVSMGNGAARSSTAGSRSSILKEERAVCGATRSRWATCAP